MNEPVRRFAIENDKPKCFCGVTGAYGADEAALLNYYMLHALQHRGQESAGVISRDYDGSTVHFRRYKGEGLVTEVFSNFEEWGGILKGDAAIGHNRYSTTGSKTRRNIQPFKVKYHGGNIAVAHNGNLTNERELRDRLEHEGAIFQTTSDTEAILHLVARSKASQQIDQIVEALAQLQGAYCLTILTDDAMIAARDPYGFRPLSIGKKDGAFLAASETCAFDLVGAEYVRDVEPGEVVVFDRDALETGEPKSIRLPLNPDLFRERKTDLRKHCIFEFIYFSRPDSAIFGHNVDKIRRRLGKTLAEKHPVAPKVEGERVIVISVPDSSNTAALGYAHRMRKQGVNARFEIGLIRSHYIGRTFIEPGQDRREMAVRIKFNTVKGVLKGKTVVVVDDSIVRGTTSRFLMKLLREAEPKEVHMRVSSPPITHPCFYGMDFPSRDELIANKMGRDVEKIGEYIGVDSLAYLTHEEMLDALYDDDPTHFCTACFSGEYPTEIDFTMTKERNEA